MVLIRKSRDWWPFLMSESTYLFLYLLVLTTQADPGVVLRHPTRVPGSPHLVTRTEFPYLYWRPSPRPYTPAPPSISRQEPTAYPYFYGESVGDNVTDTTTWQALPIQLPDDLVGAFDERTTHSTTTQTPPYPTQPSPQYGRHPGMTERPHLFYPERRYTPSRAQIIRRVQGLNDLNTAPSYLDQRYPSHESTAFTIKDSPHTVDGHSIHPRPSHFDISGSNIRRQSQMDQPKIPRPSKVPNVNRIPNFSSWPWSLLTHNQPGGNRHRPDSQQHFQDKNVMQSAQDQVGSSASDIPPFVDFNYETQYDDDYDYGYHSEYEYEYTDDEYYSTEKRPSNDYKHHGGIRWHASGVRRPSDEKPEPQGSHFRPSGVQLHTNPHRNDHRYQVRPQEPSDPPRKQVVGRPHRRPGVRPRPGQQKDPNNIDRITGIGAVPSVLVPGGMLIVAVALALFYFNFIWYPTPVVTARLIQMISNSAPNNFLNDSQRVAVEKMYEVFRSLETEYTQEPELWTPDCKSRFVCQVHDELPGLWQVTQTIAAIVRSTLATGPHGNNSFNVFLEAAQHGAEDSNCSHYYSSCHMEQLPITLSLQNAMNAGLENVTEVVYN